MTLADTTTTETLPHWEETPDDLGAAIREIKTALRARIEASGRTVDEVFAVISERIRVKVSEIAAAKERGETVWPVIEYADIENGTVTPEELAKLRSRGCLVVRGHFPREQALAWDQDIVDYVESNQFFENYRGPGDDFFGSVGSKPEIYPIYWSPAQMQARQSDRMARVQSFLNAQWTSESDGVQWFDPNRDSLYPDRIRRRPEGADSAGLGTHLDPGTLDLWMTSAYQNAFRHLFDGTVEQYDPWDAAYRTSGPQYPGSTMCSAFRTFQGWTALSDMDHDQGVLHTVPIPEAMGYLMLRPLLDDVADDDMCGVTVNQVFPANEKLAPPAARGAQRDSRRQGRRLRLVARRHDPQRRPGRGPAGVGQRHVHPGRALVPTEREVRSLRPGSLPHRVEPQRLPGGALRTRVGQPFPGNRPERHRTPRTRHQLSRYRCPRRHVTLGCPTSEGGTASTWNGRPSRGPSHPG